MGLHRKVSSSAYDYDDLNAYDSRSKVRSNAYDSYSKFIKTKPPMKNSAYDWSTGTFGGSKVGDIDLPNPDPKNYVIEKLQMIGDYLVVEITYPDCTNYEGKKCMLYKDIEIQDLIEQGSIDPHFCDNNNFHSPIARFEPTERGWNMAVYIAEKMDIIK